MAEKLSFIGKRQRHDKLRFYPYSSSCTCCKNSRHPIQYRRDLQTGRHGIRQGSLTDRISRTFGHRILMRRPVCEQSARQGSRRRNKEDRGIQPWQGDNNRCRCSCSIQKPLIQLRRRHKKRQCKGNGTENIYHSGREPLVCFRKRFPFAGST